MRILVFLAAMFFASVSSAAEYRVVSASNYSTNATSEVTHNFTANVAAVRVVSAVSPAWILFSVSPVSMAPGPATNGSIYLPTGVVSVFLVSGRLLLIQGTGVDTVSVTELSK